MTGRTALYRHWDASGSLLYVGISLSAVQRLAQHRASAGWYSEISSVTIEWFATRHEAIRAERRAILAQKPRHNIAHNRRAANDNNPWDAICPPNHPDDDSEDCEIETTAVYIVRCMATKRFHGLFWAQSLSALWDTFDEFGDPLGYEFAQLPLSGGLCHPRDGVTLSTGTEMEGGKDLLSWAEFRPSEMLFESLLDQDDLEWEPFCAADEKYGLIARVFEAVCSSRAGASNQAKRLA